MPRRILLLEPKYKNKYPPIGLMKISTYHKTMGDEVQFFKGDLRDLVLSELVEQCIKSLYKLNGRVHWSGLLSTVRGYLKTKKLDYLTYLPSDDSDYFIQYLKCLNDYADIYRNKRTEFYPKWDRVYVTTLFTFYWKVTVEAIHFAKHLVNDPNELLVGGVLASLLQEELKLETGVRTMPGLLDKPGMLDPSDTVGKSLIVDNLPLDYSILDEIEYEYPTGSAYFTFMTKGCTRKCSFCSVPILEPTYKPKIETKDKFFETKNLFGEQQNLLLMDNNVLASPLFPEIIEEIKQMGFYKGATFVEPNQLDISIRNLGNNVNDRAYVRKCFRLLQQIRPRIKGVDNKATFEQAMLEFDLDTLETVTKENLLLSYKVIGPLYDKYRSKVAKLRYVDFNQGTDARYVTDELMKLMSEIPIKPLRIAFDYWGMKDKYEQAVRLAAKHGIAELSNYILYNFKDTPEELFKRLEINVLLSEELNISIYSFPMKYIPLFGEEAKSRDYIGGRWNRKYIRAIQSILNVTKGIVAPGRQFFNKAFGRDISEFTEILYMPETYIIYRKVFDSNGMTNIWRDQMTNLSTQDLGIAKSVIEKNDFSEFSSSWSVELIAFLQHYLIRPEDVPAVTSDADLRSTKAHFDRLIKTDRFKNLTLTYDFEDEVIAR